MAVILDTGFLVGFLNSQDAHHHRARRLWDAIKKGQHGKLLSSDLVLVETLNFLRQRPGDPRLSRQAWRLYAEPASAVGWLATGTDDLRQAAEFHLERYDRGISLTDATLVIHARNLGAKIATFDKGFAGLAETLPS